MARGSGDEFYVGYLDHAPPGLARRLKRIVVALACAAPVLAGGVAALQRPLPDGVFEFGVVREFEGVLYTTPVPYLRPTVPVAGSASGSGLLLVSYGKRGLPPELRRYDGQKIRLDGSLIYRRNVRMVQIDDPAAVRLLGPPGPGEGRGRHETIGRAELIGELVDSKCFLGVMRPATGKVHRACAVRCLEGGIPPALLVRNVRGESTVFLLTAEDGGPLEFDLQMAARTVRVEGVVEVHDGLPTLRVGRIGLK